MVGRQRAHRRTQYAEYMASGRWHARRRRWIEQEQERSGAEVCCAVCGGEFEDLHHLTYDRLGGERHEDMVALCRVHHDQVHRAYDQGRWRGIGYEAVMRRLLRLACEEYERRGA